MNRFNFLVMLAFAASLFIGACNPIEDDMDLPPDPDHSNWIALLGMSGGGPGDNNLLCYNVVYPISFILPNGNEILAENEGQMIGLLNANPAPIQIVFPITLEDEDGNTIEVMNEDELQMYLDMCEPEVDDWQDIFGDDDLFDCYSIQFPIDVEMTDGTTEPVGGIDELIALFDDEPYPTAPVFPLTLIDQDGNPVSVGGFDDLDDLVDACDDDDNEWEPGDLECYELGFPVEVLLEDGSSATADDPTEFAQILIGDPAPVDFVFPIILIDEDGNEISADNPDHLEDLIEGCDDDDPEGIDWDELFDNDCYVLVYEQEVLLSDGTTMIVVDEDALLAAFDFEPYPVDFVYPGYLLDADGNEYEFYTEAEFYALLDEDDCEGETECSHGLMTSFFNTLADLDSPTFLLRNGIRRLHPRDGEW